MKFAAVIRFRFILKVADKRSDNQLLFLISALNR